MLTVDTSLGRSAVKGIDINKAHKQRDRKGLHIHIKTPIDVEMPADRR